MELLNLATLEPDSSKKLDALRTVQELLLHKVIARGYSRGSKSELVKPNAILLANVLMFRIWMVPIFNVRKHSIDIYGTDHSKTEHLNGDINKDRNNSLNQ